MATIRDVAREAGVSTGTVSRAFNGYKDIHPVTRKRVFEAACRLGYSPNVNAKSLSSKSSSNMGLIISDFLESDRKNGFALDLLKGTYRYASLHQLEVALYAQDAAGKNAKSYGQFCTEHSIFGAVLSGVETEDVYFEQLVAAKLPCVLIDAYVRGNGLSCVTTDFKAAAREMTDYLLDAGHRNLLVVEGKRESRINQDQIAGICEAFAKRGMSLSEKQILTGEMQENTAYEKVKAYLFRYGKSAATAFLCLSDEMALGVMRAVTEAGYAIPDDFSVTGFDGIPIGEYTTPALTTIERDMERIGYHAAQVLQELGRHPEQSKCVSVPYRLIERNSVKKIL
ncbi:MAG: LacI family transcriptional regulator [Fusicatenibacter sp.]|nr:LacI family transcriptional regulator [Fusicatenibacter sp.]MDD7739678.1 LacI family DNA-binding transcriptional regulator [Lachnospiraceae bacterium]